MLLYKLGSILIIFLTISLSGCGFRPLYSKEPYNKKFVNAIASISVSDIHTVQGTKFINSLRNTLNPNNIAAPTKYILDSTLTNIQSYLELQQDSTVTSYKTIITVDYKLRDITTNKLIASGKLQRENNFDKSASEFSTFVSEETANDDATEYLAHQLGTIIISSVIKNTTSN